jgi:integrase
LSNKDSLYKRFGSPYWYFDIAVAGRKRIRRSTRTSDRKEAAKVAARIMAAEWHRYTVGDKSALTFAEAVMLYIQAGRDETYLEPLARHFKDTPVKDISAGAIRSAARVLYPKCSAATWNRQVITPARAVINHAAENDLANYIRIKGFAESPPVKEAADRAWLDSFTAHADARYGALARFMVCTSARIGQSIELEWSNVDLTRAEVIIPASKKHPERKAHLTAEAVAALANLKTRRGRVFGYRHRWSVYKRWRRICSSAGITYLPPHQSGRHTFATEMIVRNRIDPKTVATLGGWKSVKLLLDRYVHPENAKGIIEAVFGTNRAQSPGDTQPKSLSEKGKP